MDVAVACLGIAGSIILTVVLLTLFFRLLGRLDRRRPGDVERLEARSVLGPRQPITIRLVDRSVMADVRLLGTFAEEFDRRAPMPLRDMLIVAHPDGRRTLIRAKDVRSMELPPQT
jgi:hypothetical protein